VRNYNVPRGNCHNLAFVFGDPGLEVDRAAVVLARHLEESVGWSLL
jgi:hypothetical protein